MNDYEICLKRSCACGATFEITDARGNHKWMVEESDKWEKKHADCSRLKFPEVKIPKASAK